MSESFEMFSVFSFRTSLNILMGHFRHHKLVIPNYQDKRMAEKYTLNWHTFSEHLQLMFRDLYEEGKNSDVTLVSDDQTQFKAHKIVLSACSPVFKKIIDNNPSQHPMIYLRGIQSYEMESIFQFMYLGEGKFYYERMAEFIKVAKDLEVKEISKGVELPNMEEIVTEFSFRT